jgi:CHAD domain-containing protein/adenylate cyclase class IV
MRTTVERELKLEAEEGFELPDLGGERLTDRVFTSTYYDTPSRSLASAGITLRRRIENRRPLWQLKLPRAGTARTEIEARGSTAGPPVELTTLLAVHLRTDGLEPIAVLRTRRTGIHAVEGARSVADVTVDDVDILEGRRRVGRFVELEIELRDDGVEDDLERIGRTLRRAGARRSEGRAKVMRVAPVDTQPAPQKSTTLRDLVVYHLRRQLEQLHAHDPGVRLGEHPEDVHRMRVATRRSRALIRATRSKLGDRLEPLSVELKWLGGALGPVRDLDVLLDRLRVEVAALDLDRAGGESIVAELEAERETHRTELLAALDSERYLRLFDTFAVALDSIPQELAGTAQTLAEAELRRFEKAAAAVPEDPSDDELHALRIHAKRARYTAELGALTGRKRFVRYVEAVVATQDVIGEHQDAVVAEERVRALVSPERALAAGRLIELERSRRRDARARYREVVAEAIARGRAAVA